MNTQENQLQNPDVINDGCGPTEGAGRRVYLAKQQILDIFEAAESQLDYVTALHCAVVPDWGRVEALKGFCRCSQPTGFFIMERAIEFDRLHHPAMMAGGAWMNSGFSTAGPDLPDLPDWCVELPEIIYRKDTTD